MDDLDTEEVSDDTREYDFLKEENITEDLFKGLSGYQKVILGLKASGSTVLGMSEKFGIKYETLNNHINEASAVLHRNLKRRFDGKLTPIENPNETDKDRAMDFERTIKAAAGRASSYDFYHEVIEPSIIGIAVTKGYIYPLSNENIGSGGLSEAREWHYAKKDKREVMKKIKRIGGLIERAFNGTYAKGLPEFREVMDGMERLRKSASSYKPNGKK